MPVATTKEWLEHMAKLEDGQEVGAGHASLPDALDATILGAAGFECGPRPVEAGDETCTGCWDKSDHNIEADTCVPAGEHAWYRLCNVEYDEWDAYCKKCALEYATQTY